jgi:hypothetical protein
MTGIPMDDPEEDIFEGLDEDALKEEFGIEGDGTMGDEGLDNVIEQLQNLLKELG